eukprot:2028702-Rhodomonas_salina.1
MGDGKAGKTSLVHALLKEGVTEVIAEDNRTVGIDIVEMLLGPQVSSPCPPFPLKPCAWTPTPGEERK